VDSRRITALLRKFESLKSLTIILIPKYVDMLILSLGRTPHGYRALKRDSDIEERLEGYVFNHWNYENCHRWWKKLPGIEMSILYLHHDTLIVGSLPTSLRLAQLEDNRRLRRSCLMTEDQRRMVLENLGPKINDHLQDMETWTEEPWV
jgi:hypothetical protein